MSILHGLEDLSTFELFTLSVLAREAADRRAELFAGEHNVIVGLSIAGTLRVMPDTPAERKTKPKPEDMAAAMLSCMSRTARAKALATIGQGDGLAALDFATEGKQLVDQLTQCDVYVRKGAVSGEFTIDRLGT